MEPISVGVCATATGSGIKLIQHAFAYAEVPDDVRAFQRSIESFSGTLSTTKRLRRVKSHLLDEKDKQEIDLNIKRATEILDDISTTIESCRKDLDQRSTVGVRNRIMWLIRDQHTFMARTHTLGVCHQNLNCDIAGMRQLQNPSQLPSYDSLDFGGPLRPPSRRRPIATVAQEDIDEQDMKDQRTTKGPGPKPSFYSGDYNQSKAGSLSDLEPLMKAKTHDGTVKTGSYVAYNRSFDVLGLKGVGVPQPPAVPNRSWNTLNIPSFSSAQDDERTVVEDFPTTTSPLPPPPEDYWSAPSVASSLHHRDVRRATVDGFVVPRRPIRSETSWDSFRPKSDNVGVDNSRSSLPDFDKNPSPKVFWKQEYRPNPDFEMHNHSRSSSVTDVVGSSSTSNLSLSRTRDSGSSVFSAHEEIDDGEYVPIIAPSPGPRRGRKSMMIT